MKTKQIMILILCCLLLLSACGQEAPQIDAATGAYIYPAYPGTEEWAAFWAEISDLASEENPPLSIARERMNIPEDILQEMSTDALIRSVMDYPLMSYSMDVNTPGSPKLKMETLEKFNGVQELFQREDARKKLEAQLQLLEDKQTESQSYLGLQQVVYAEGLLEELKARAGESPAPSREYSITEPYEYPIRPGMPEWAELDGLPQMGTACLIPVDILLNMSTEALVETVMDYPLLWNINAYSLNEAEGVKAVESYFNGLPALYGRPDGLSAFREHYEALSALIDCGELAEEEETEARLNLRTAGFILERMEELEARAAEWAAQGNVEQESSYSLERIPFSIPDGLSRDQRLDVLDADSTRLLYSIRENVNTGSVYPPCNQKLGLYSLESGETLLEIQLPDSQTLQNAALLPEGFVFFQNEADIEKAHKEFQLIRVDAAGQSSQLDSGSYSALRGLASEFAIQEDGTLIYSYHQEEEGRPSRFGLRAVDENGQLSTLLEIEREAPKNNDKYRSRLISNGRDYIFFLQKEKSFYRGSIDTPPEECRLKAGQLIAGELLADGGIFRLYDWAAGYWAENMLCLDMDGQRNSKKAEPNQAFLMEELCGNGKDQILGLDPEMKQIYALTVRDGLIRKELLKHEQLPQGMRVHFHNLSEDSYLLYYPQQNLIYLLRFNFVE